MAEWEAPALVLAVRAHGEGDTIATLFTEAHGSHRGLARGGASRTGAATWQAGNLVQARWVARLPEQLGTFSAELVHAAGAGVMEDALRLGLLRAACAVAEGALPEREPHPAVFGDLVRLVAGLGEEGSPAALVRWEMVLLAGLGYGLDLSSCAVTGRANDLCYVSPRSGRAVSEAGAGAWRERLLVLPEFLLDGGPGDLAAWRDGLALTGHFLARNAFGHQHRPLPAARTMLYDLVAKRAEPR